jgi:hypothetical protein
LPNKTKVLQYLLNFNRANQTPPYGNKKGSRQGEVRPV